MPGLRSCLCVLIFWAAQALPLAAAAQTPRGLPAEVASLMQRENLPPDALAVWVQEVGAGPVRLSQNAELPVNPASLAKLLTTQAGLDLLGPAWSWRTPVWLDGPVRDGVLQGSLVIQGRGDPKLVLERLWLLLKRVQQLGVREIRGDIVLDQSAFEVPDVSPAEFDNEPLRPYNARAEALLLNQKSVIYSFSPDPARGLARIGVEPTLAGVTVDAAVPLSTGPCEDWRAGLRASMGDPLRVRFAGSYAQSCGERLWPVAYPEPRAYAARLIEAMWRETGGSLSGRVREGPAPVGLAPSFEFVSPPLAEVVRDINKYSNNVMAQQLFLTLGLVQQGRGTPDAARAVLRQWLAERVLGRSETRLDGLVIDNGSGLSRETRISAALLARLLQQAWSSPVMPEFMASLPVNGLDGTLKRSKAPAGRAHLKTGSLRDVVGVAGYVLGHSGRRYVLVAMLNHPNANAARPALDALVQWTMDDQRR